MVNKERPPVLLKDIENGLSLFLKILPLLFLLFTSVSFPESKKGFEVTSDEDYEKMSEPERRLAKFLRKLGLTISYEKRQIKLDVGVKIGKKRKTGKDKIKSLTTPDFYFRHEDIDYFIELGSHHKDGHKKGQAAVVEKAVTFKKGRKILYLQVFREDIDFIINNIKSDSDFIDYVYEHPEAIFTHQRV